MILRVLYSTNISLLAPLISNMSVSQIKFPFKSVAPFRQWTASPDLLNKDSHYKNQQIDLFCRHATDKTLEQGYCLSDLLWFYRESGKENLVHLSILQQMIKVTGRTCYLHQVCCWTDTKYIGSIIDNSKDTIY